MKNNYLKSALLVSLLASMMALSACEQDGPMEQAGEKIDNTADKAGDALNDAADDASDSLESAADEIKDATN